MTSHTTAAININDVGFHYPDRDWVLRDCTAHVERGRVLAVLAPNGRGKTTLLKLMAGAISPQAGSVAVAGRVAFLPQEAHVQFAYSVFDVVLMGRARHVGLFSVPGKADEALAKDALERIGISALAARPFDQLSGGERRLVMFARALASQAEILVLDEPCSGLDLKNQRVVLGWIRRLSREGLTIVFTTHQPQHADAVADDALLMFEPSRQVSGSAADILTEENLSALFDVPLRRVRIGSQILYGF